MKKVLSFISSSAVLLIVGFIFMQAEPVKAQATVACPDGYVCTPINQQAVQCPAGYICTPINNTSTTVTTPVATSIVSSGTNTPCYNFSRNLMQNSNGSDVTALQTFLNSNGFPVQGENYFGNTTKTALRNYQSSVGIPSTGFFGPLTKAKINASCGVSTTTTITPIPSSSSITVLSPKGGEIYNVGDNIPITWGGSWSGNDTFRIQWEQNKGDIEKGGSIVTGLTQVQAGCTGYGKGVCGYSWTPTYPTGQIQIGVFNTRTNEVMYSGSFSVSSPNTPLPSIDPVNYCYKGQIYLNGLCTYPTPSISQTSDVTVSAYLADASVDKVGASYGQGAGISNQNPNDWHWRMTINAPEAKTVQSIGITSNSYGEGWSTSNDTSLLGKVLYPIYVVANIIFNNNAYNQTMPITSGTSYLDLYGQPETTPFAGGTLYVKFTDGTTATAVIPASNIMPSGSYNNYVKPTPTVTPVSQNTVQPFVTVLSPNGTEKFTAGQPITVSWKINGFDSYGPRVINISLLKNGQIINMPGFSGGYYQTSDTNSSATFNLPSSLVSGDDYKVRVTKPGNIDYSDDSDQPFPILSTTTPITSNANSGEVSTGSVWNAIGDWFPLKR